MHSFMSSVCLDGNHIYNRSYLQLCCITFSAGRLNRVTCLEFLTRMTFTQQMMK